MSILSFIIILLYKFSVIYIGDKLCCLAFIYFLWENWFFLFLLLNLWDLYNNVSSELRRVIIDIRLFLKIDSFIRFINGFTHTIVERLRSIFKCILQCNFHKFKLLLIEVLDHINTMCEHKFSLYPLMYFQFLAS
jgi:hypothetical protein